MFGMLIICYLFLGGCGAGLLFVTSVTSLLFYASEHRTAYSTLVFAGVRDRCLSVGFVLLIIASLCLVGDLGRPERVVYLVLRPRWSVITFGAYALAALMTVCGVRMLLAIFGFSQAHGGVKRGLEIVCAVLALPVMVYTGVFLQSMRTVALWDNAWLSVLFALSALSTGFSAFFVALSVSDGVEGIDDIVGKLHTVHALSLFAESAALVAFVAVAVINPEAHDSLRLLFEGSFFPWFAMGVVGMGLIVPLIVELMYIAGMCRGGFPLGEVLCLAGGFALRYCIVGAAVH